MIVARFSLAAENEGQGARAKYPPLWRFRFGSKPEKRYWRLRRLESAVPAQLALKNVTLRKGRDTLSKVRQSGTCCAEREQPICTASRWQLMESLSGTAVSSTVAIVGSIWPKGPAQAGPVIQAQWFICSSALRLVLRLGRGGGGCF